MIVAFDRNIQSKQKPISNDYKNLNIGFFVEGEIQGLKQGASSLRIEVFRLSKLRHDYLVFLHEFNEQKNSYQSCIVIRARIVANTEPGGQSILKTYPETADLTADVNRKSENLTLLVRIIISLTNR